MKGYEIRQRLSDKSIKVGDIAESIGISSAAVSKVLHGHGRSRRIEALIAQALGLPVEQVFPDRVSKE